MKNPLLPLVILMSLVISACAYDTPNAFLPQPNRPADKGRYGTSMYVLPDHVVVREVYGLPPERAETVVAILVQALLNHEVIATSTQPKQRTTQLHGRVVTDQSGMAYLQWILLDPYGSTVDEFETILPRVLTRSDDAEGNGPDANLVKISAEEIAEIVARRIAPRGTVARVERENKMVSAAPERQTTATGPGTGSVRGESAALSGKAPSILISAVFGAPYDGGPLLRQGLTAALLQAGYVVTDRPLENTLQVQATVSAAESRPGILFLSINWEVKSVSGKVLATVEQANEVSSADLELGWQGLIEPITQGAVMGISNYLAGQDAGSP